MSQTAVITAPDRRLRVLVSSTLGELGIYRTVTQEDTWDEPRGGAESLTEIARARRSRPSTESQMTSRCFRYPGKGACDA